MHLRDRNMYICTAAIELLKSQQKSWVLAVLPQFLRSVTWSCVGKRLARSRWFGELWGFQLSFFLATEQ